MAEEYYKTLGVEKTANADEIKRAYRKLAAKYHPDVNKSSDAEATFKKVQEAWEVLSDPQKKAMYDRYGSAGGSGGGGFGGNGGFSGGGFNPEDFSDFMGGFDGGIGQIFETFFGGAGGSGRRGPERGRNIHTETTVSLAEAVSGKKHNISIEAYESCSACEGAGKKKGTGMKSCQTCAGTGQVARDQQTPLGYIRTASVCPNCRGEGRIPEHPCPSCSGTGRMITKRNIGVEIPPGVFDGALLRVPEKGEAGERGQPSGDLLLKVNVTPDRRFRRDGNDIHSEVSISLFEAVLGNEREVETVQGKVTTVISPGTQPDAVIRIRSKGMPILNRNQFGDHLIHIRVNIPKKLSKKEKELFLELAKESGEKLKHEKGFLEGLFS
ncbi:molecular chaperone DnaJ [Candidatus Peregrinibacteria bacterium]|nr:MAG: molecular chaperone DnaJ [Candidatus Peregrinibacteria bacterium]